ncbi:MAG TPA: 4-hydroxy-tetrahydrodipicolinate synthase [Candidatus Bathyarchaeia archaeon]|nr:4-hydroxy-tetrahydrodipicolinate synthase [Candidatus Bathyarchaeia archaeon]
MNTYRGAFTAVVTPFVSGGKQMDYEGLRRLCEFQVESGISGIVSVGTTGESPTLTWNEHNKAFKTTFDSVGSKTIVIASTGSNSTSECYEGTSHAREMGIRDVLLVDPYYNGPSSLEIRREYLEPIASAFPDVGVIPYIIPGRCGTQLLPQDLAIANHRYQNIFAVKEATGDFENMKQIRKLCGDNFTILSGDDDKTLQMMLDPSIRSSGVISVVSNVAPKSVQDMCQYALRGDERAAAIANTLKPLFDIVAVKTIEETARGQVHFRARNPVPIKTLMGILGLPCGPLRPPLGRLTKQAIELVIGKARKVQADHPEVFKPLSDFFDVDVDDRLNNDKYRHGWYYDAY